MESQFYLTIRCQNDITSIGQDDNERAMFTFDILANASGIVTTWASDIIQILQDAGLGTKGVDIFVLPSATIPSVRKADPIITLKEVGGPAPQLTKGDLKTRTYPGMQVVTRGYDAQEARSLAANCFKELCILTNVTITTQ